MIQAVIFDMDGVLFDTEQLGSKQQLKALSEMGYTVTEELIISTMGSSMAASREMMLDALGRDFPFAKMIERWTELMYEDMAQNGIPQKPGIQELLGVLKEKGIKTAVATSNNRSIVEDYLKLAGLTNSFDAVVCGDSIQRSKPASDIYLAAAEKLGTEPEKCMGVEDSANGVKSVRAAGMVCVMVPDMIPFTKALSPYVDHCVPTLKDIIPLL